MTQQINLAEQAVLPTGQSLTLDGNVTFNGTVTGVVTTPAGSNMELQYNNAGAFGASSKLKWDDSIATLSINDDGWKQLFFYNGLGTIDHGYLAADSTVVELATSSALRLFGSTVVAESTVLPAASALFDITSTTKGFLAPRMTTIQRDAIPTPATGLQIYNTTTNELNVYNGTSWIAVGTPTLPAGANKEIQYNNGGVFGADINFRWDSGVQQLIVGDEAGGGPVAFMEGSSGLIQTYNNGATLFSELQPTGIYSGGNSRNPKAIIQADSTTQGFLGPRLTTAERDAIATPPTGLEIYNTTTGRPEYYTGSTWNQVGSGTVNSGAVGLIASYPSTGTAVSGSTGFFYTSGKVILGSGLTLNLEGTGTRINFGVTGLQNTISIAAVIPASAVQTFTLPDMGGNAKFLLDTGNNVGPVGIGETPVASSLLDVASTTKGFLLPRMTTTQKNAIVSPATGLLVYDTDLGYLQEYNGSIWTNVSPVTSPAGANTEVQFNNSGSFGASSSFTWNGTTLTATRFAGTQIDVNGTKAIDLSVGTGRSLVTSGGTFVVDWQNTVLATSGGTSINWGSRTLNDSSGGLVLTWNTSGITLAASKTLEFTDSTTNKVTLQAPTSVTPYTVKWPTAQGAANTVMLNDGSGNLSWQLNGTGTIQQNTYTVGTALNTYTGSTTVFNLPFTYVQDGRSLQVMYNGQVLVSGVDYNETANNIVTFTSALTVGATAQFRSITPSTPSNTSVAQYVNYVVGTASGSYTGSTTVFNLPFAYTQDGKSLEVYYDGVQLVPGDDYTETTSTSITTTQALVSSQKIAFRTISTIGNSAAVTALRENYVAGTASGNYTGSLTVFDLVNTYTPGGINLQVFLDGDLQTVGASNDYVETDSNTVTFNFTLVAGQKVTFLFSQTVAATGTVTSATSGQLAYYPSTGSTVSGTSGPIQLDSGSAATPTYSFSTDTDTGIYSGGANDLRIAAGGTSTLFINSNGVQVNSGVLTISNAGSVSAPAITFEGDTDTGIYTSGANTIRIATGATQRLRVDGNGVTTFGTHYLSDGSAASPSLSFDLDTDTGIYRAAANAISMSANAGNALISLDGGAQVFDIKALVRPDADNTWGMGSSVRRWTAVWAVNGTIQTSHSSTKTDIVEMDPLTLETPRGIFFKRPGEEKVHVGFEADNLPKQAFYEDGVSIETSSVIGVLCAKVRYLEAELKKLKGE